jgi:hypothetical protein
MLRYHNVVLLLVPQPIRFFFFCFSLYVNRVDYWKEIRGKIMFMDIYLKIAIELLRILHFVDV